MEFEKIGAIAAIIVLLGFAAAALIFAFIDAPGRRKH